MSDPTPTPVDDLIRRALQGEADGLQASDELLDRTLASAHRPRVHTGRWLLTAAAVIAIVAIGVAVATTRDDDEPVESAGDPETTTTTTAPLATQDDLLRALGVLYPCREGDVVRLSVMVEGPEATAVSTALQSDDRARDVTAASSDSVAAALRIPIGSVSPDDVPSAFSATFATEEDELAVVGAISDLPGVLATSTVTCSGTPTEPSGERPTTVVLVREDGVLVVVDLETGEERELHSLPEVGTPEDADGYYIEDVELSPDGQWVYFSTCCEPIDGPTYRIPTSGGTPERVADGRHPRLSPDGRFVATAAGSTTVQISPADGGSPLASVEVPCCEPSAFAWSPDGAQIAAVTIIEGSYERTGDLQHQVVLFGFDGSSLTQIDPGRPDNPGRFVAWAPYGDMTTMSGGGSLDSSRSFSQDASYEWFLWVDGEGVVREQAGLSSGELPAIPGLPEAISADW
jgi:hypothetical protein